MFVDTMDNTANISYGAHPERLFIINKGVVHYEGGIGPFYYNVEEVGQWLKEYRQEQKNVQLNQVFRYQ